MAGTESQRGTPCVLQIVQGSERLQGGGDERMVSNAVQALKDLTSKEPDDTLRAIGGHSLEGGQESGILRFVL